MSTSAEDREVMERIARLASRVNRHKNQQAGLIPPPPFRAQHRMSIDSKSARRTDIDVPKDTGYYRGSHRGHPYRGYHGAPRPVHRNRTLVLNGASPSSRSVDDLGASSDTSTSSWVHKNDRHLQIINSSVYQQEAPSRRQAMEQTRQQQLAAKNRQERAKLISHLNRLANNGGYETANHQKTAGKYVITVDGIQFTVTKQGSKLVKVPGASSSRSTGDGEVTYPSAGDGNSAKATPRMAVVGGVKFYRSKNGNLYRHGVVKAQRQSGTVKKVNVPCKQFSMMGSCAKGPQCRYTHDPHKVAICKDFLLGGCPNGDDCDLSHDPTPERTPACLHYARDSCTKSDCKYAHVKVSTAAPVCRSFGFYGYCEGGAECPERHVFECPDFSNTGTCKIRGCKLPHRERASVLRKASSSKSEDVEMEDVSSDDDGESIDDYDVDSDEVDEFIGEDETGGLDFTEQKDFIEL
ncbi:hypothetical protein QC764_117710 [Podospora pseudoanserina]|uniref:C3H1-type domain-containing protein n=1 Tax=Podospora pseudoanserina TaxID=2609844 RepID=A0ABR0IQE2_9PEZI|nr:hypothetical protein QC764_117710 [Podospora pseudoanserina]